MTKDYESIRDFFDDFVHDLTYWREIDGMRYYVPDSGKTIFYLRAVVVVIGIEKDERYLYVWREHDDTRYRVAVPDIVGFEYGVGFR